MGKVRKAVSVLALSTAVLTGTANGAGAAGSSPTETGPCTVSGAFCATSDNGGPRIVLYCGMSQPVYATWTGGGYWNNRLPRNGVVRMFDETTVKYVTPPNYGPVRGNWGPIYSLRADC
ncbi:hypothetical protein GCM10023086_75110 [Streptomyces venetus]|uniref:Secreted protein n=1 Tax=Streptomyces venetus TaxID=1701086 RepID=A0ABP8HIL1_9ACTN